MSVACSADPLRGGLASYAPTLHLRIEGVHRRSRLPQEDRDAEHTRPRLHHSNSVSGAARYKASKESVFIELHCHRAHRPSQRPPATDFIFRLANDSPSSPFLDHQSATMAPTTTTASHSATTAAASFPSCTTAVPGKYGYVPPDACNSDYNYNPSFGAAVAFAVLFGLVFAGHLGQAIRFKKGFCWVIIMACFWELLAFIFRAMGAHDQQQLGYVIGFTLLLLLAPLCE